MASRREAKRSVGPGISDEQADEQDTGWEGTPWHATQRAAWETLKKAEEANR